MAFPYIPLAKLRRPPLLLFLRSNRRWNWNSGYWKHLKFILPSNYEARVHRHFVLYGLMEFLRKSLDRHFSPDEVLQLLDRFYNLEVLKPDDEEIDILNHEEDFCLPQSYFVKEEP
ncbi:Nucleoporin [Gossypium arboreum]|uniref:Nucleoporin n=1 Tax=Gossypium arboreum TaxID=29729 RepID=A0A0B0N964_GOSAR|nr:Nucleoporin [Gossypium arboreum]